MSQIAPMSHQLREKLACLVYYLQQVRAGRRESNPDGVNALLDDTELNNWIDSMNKHNLIGTRL